MGLETFNTGGNMMKRLVAPLIAISLLIPAQRVDALFGVGLKYVGDSFSVGEWSDGTQLYQLNGSGFDGAGLGGLFVYIDAIPFIDLEASFEMSVAPYDLDFHNDFTSLPSTKFAWTRLSTYYTARKEVFGLGLPILGGGAIHVGGGINSHQTSKLADLDMMSGIIGDLATGGEGMKLESQVEDFVKNKDNWIEGSGVHLQAGLQMKILTFSAFVNYRITMAEDVVPDAKSFSSIWAGLAFGL